MRPTFNTRSTLASEANDMNPAESGQSAQRRARLAAKGRILYAKMCGMKGKKTCVESFALYHIGRGEAEVARDLLAFLESTRDSLRAADPEGQLARTDELTERIRQYLKSDVAESERSL